MSDTSDRLIYLFLLFSSLCSLVDRDIALCMPCVACGVLWSWVSRKYQHFAVLPLTMLAVPAVFFIGLGMSGYDIQARVSDT